MVGYYVRPLLPMDGSFGGGPFVFGGRSRGGKAHTFLGSSWMVVIPLLKSCAIFLAALAACCALGGSSPPPR